MHISWAANGVVGSTRPLHSKRSPDSSSSLSLVLAHLTATVPFRSVRIDLFHLQILISTSSIHLPILHRIHSQEEQRNGVR